MAIIINLKPTNSTKFERIQVNVTPESKLHNYLNEFLFQFLLLFMTVGGMYTTLTIQEEILENK